MMRTDVALESVLRRAMARAGITTGYAHVCRKKGCSHRTEAPDAELRRCPFHGDSLWPKPSVRSLRFHDLRHTCASLLLQSWVPMAVVQRVLRHRDPRLTSEIYGHFAPDDLQAEIGRLRLFREAGGGGLVPLTRTEQGARTEHPSNCRKNAGAGENFLSDSGGFGCARYWIRTSGLWLRRPTLYPSELIAQDDGPDPLSYWQTGGGASGSRPLRGRAGQAALNRGRSPRRACRT